MKMKFDWDTGVKVEGKRLKIMFTQYWHEIELTTADNLFFTTELKYKMQ